MNGNGNGNGISLSRVSLSVIFCRADMRDILIRLPTGLIGNSTNDYPGGGNPKPQNRRFTPNPVTLHDHRH